MVLWVKPCSFNAFCVAVMIRFHLVTPIKTSKGLVNVIMDGATMQFSQASDNSSRMPSSGGTKESGPLQSEPAPAANRTGLSDPDPLTGPFFPHDYRVTYKDYSYLWFAEASFDYDAYILDLYEEDGPDFLEQAKEIHQGGDYLNRQFEFPEYDTTEYLCVFKKLTIFHNPMEVVFLKRTQTNAGQREMDPEIETHAAYMVAKRGIEGLFKPLSQHQIFLFWCLNRRFTYWNQLTQSEEVIINMQQSDKLLVVLPFFPSARYSVDDYSIITLDQEIFGIDDVVQELFDQVHESIQEYPDYLNDYRGLDSEDANFTFFEDYFMFKEFCALGVTMEVMFLLSGDTGPEAYATSMVVRHGIDGVSVDAVKRALEQNRRWFERKLHWNSLQSSFPVIL